MYKRQGYYDYFGGGGQLVPVTLGSYDPAAGTYATVATINLSLIHISEPTRPY